VNDECLIVVIEHEDHLQHSTAIAWSPNEPLVVRKSTRNGTFGSADDHFRFRGHHPVTGDMFGVPFVPPKVHDLIKQQNRRKAQAESVRFFNSIPWYL
jgi:hypothetical protein